MQLVILMFLCCKRRYWCSRRYVANSKVKYGADEEYITGDATDLIVSVNILI